MKISNLETIYLLYKEGRISRATWYRAKKRGWIKVDYHHPHNQGGDVEWFYNNSTSLEVRDNLLKIASRIVSTYGKVYNLADVEDLANEGILYLYERGEDFNNKARFYSVAKSYIKHLFTKGAAFRSRAYSSTSIKEIYSGESKDLDSGILYV